MIRFIDLGEQIISDYREFAYFDTITDTFLMIGGEQTWASFDEIDWSAEGRHGGRELKERCLGLTPTWALESESSKAKRALTPRLSTDSSQG